MATRRPPRVRRIFPRRSAGILRRIAEKHRGRRARIVVASGERPGHVVADLPLVSLAWREARDGVDILLGDARYDVWYPHEVWGIREIVLELGADGITLRMGYAGGNTALILAGVGRPAFPVPAPARAAAVA